MNKGMIIGVVVVLVVLAGGGFLLSQQNKATPSPEPTSQSTPLESASPEATTEGTSSGIMEGESVAGTKTFTVTGSPFKFEPATLSVNKGDKVTITFKNASGTHDFTLDDFDVQTKQLASGASETVTFTASKAGSFEYYCSVGNHKAQGMKGTLTVK